MLQRTNLVVLKSNVIDYFIINSDFKRLIVGAKNDHFVESFET